MSNFTQLFPPIVESYLPAFDAQTVDFEYPLSRFNKWKMGKKYVYNITITFNEITITPSVTDWDAQNNAEDVQI